MMMARKNSYSLLDKYTIVQEYTISVLIVDYRINVVDYNLSIFGIQKINKITKLDLIAESARLIKSQIRLVQPNVNQNVIS